MSEQQTLMTRTGDGGRWGSMPAARRRRLALALVVAVAGTIALVAGWVGATRTRILSDQLSYIASGGLVGAVLIGVAGAILLSDFMVEQEYRLGVVEATLARMEAKLDGPSSGAGGVTRRPGDPGSLLALEGGQRVHRSDCQLVQGKDGARAVSAAQAREEGLTSCRVCEPGMEASPAEAVAMT